MRLLVRADDAGLCAAVNHAIVEAVHHGVARNVSVMAPTPAFEAAAAMLRDLPGIAVGLHVTLTSEWHAPRWGPVLPVAQVRSLVDPTGCFRPSAEEIENQGGIDVTEAIAEVEAQLGQARRAGLAIRYLDEHMGVGRLPGVRDGLRALAGREGLVYAPDAARLPGPEGEPTADLADDLAGRIRAADDGTYVVVTHPGRDEPELRQIRGVGFEEPGAVAVERDGDRRALVSEVVRRACRDRDVELIRYTDLEPTGHSR